MITFEGSNYRFELFSYILEEPILRSYNMGRIHFNFSPIDIDYIEGSLYETDTEWIENFCGVREPIITRMTIMSIHKIKFKNGDEVISKDLIDARIGLAVPPIDINQQLWNEEMRKLENEGFSNDFSEEE